MADRLGYHMSTLYRELARNSTKIGYRPDIANQKSTLRRRQGYNLKLEVDEELRCYVIEKLKERWSPLQISERLAKERGHSVISHESIYQFIYSQSGKDLQLYKYLRKKRSHRYPKRSIFRGVSNLYQCACFCSSSLIPGLHLLHLLLEWA